MRKISYFLAVFLMMAVMFLAGCSKITKENYDRIKLGMTQEEVISILGKSDSCESMLGADNCIWGDANKNITIKFIGGNVVFFSSKGI